MAKLLRTANKLCTYNLKSSKKTFGTYAELVEFLIENSSKLGIGNIDDVVYSKYPYRDLLREKIINLKADYKPKSQQDFVDLVNGEPLVEGAMSILDYLDSPACAINGLRLVTPLSKLDYINTEVLKLKAEASNLSIEECEAIVNETVKNWDKIQHDSILLHSALTDKSIYDINAKEEDFVDKFKREFKDSRLEDSALLLNLFKGLKNFYKREKGFYPDSFNITNVNLEITLKDNSQKIFGHIDNLFIDKNGTLHLYLFKTTSEAPKKWARVKREKYKYQLAFLKRMLANKGIDVSNIELKIVPVQLEYSKDFNTIENLKVLPTIPYSSRFGDPEYSMEKYDREVATFLEDNSLTNYDPGLIVERAGNVNSAIFPELNINKRGYIGESAKEWILQAPNIDPTGTEPLVIKEVDDGYEVTINGTLHKINSRKNKNKNKEIFDLVSEHISELNDNKGYSTQRLKEVIQDSYRKGFISLNGIPGFDSGNLEEALGKYFSDYETLPNGTKQYNWELLEDVINSNVLVFKNRNTNTYEFVALSAFNLNAKVRFNKGLLLLGSYVPDASEQRSELLATWGNIELVRTMELINEIIPNLGQAKLGSVAIISAVGRNPFIRKDIGLLNKQHFNHILQVVSAENSELNIKNNFRNVEFVDPIDTLLEEYDRIMEGRLESELNMLMQYGFDELTEAKTLYQQINALQNIISEIYELKKIFLNPYEVLKALLRGGLDGDLARLLDLTTKALLSLQGESPQVWNDLQPMDKMLFTATTVPDPNILIVVNNLQITHDTIASEFLKEFKRDMFDDFYLKIGYNNVQNMTIGNQAQQYSNLYEIDVHTGKKTMSFKNPYDYNNDLKPEERELLKKVLFLIAYINSNGNIRFSGYNDSRLPEYIRNHPEYLWVPLIRASKATQRQSLDSVKAKLKNSFRRFKNATERFDEFVNGITPDEREILGMDNLDFYLIRLKNPFELSMPSSSDNRGVVLKLQKRSEMLEKYGPDFFEYNLENIYIEFLVKHIATTQFNKLLIGTKALMLQLYLTADYGGNLEKVQKEIKWILDYLKVNVFNNSIMSPLEKKIIGIISPIKTIVSHMLIGGNLVSAIRDIFEGTQLNFLRAFIKFNTDIKPDNLAKAYLYVTTHSTSDAMAVNLLGKLCSKYRISNTDVGRVAERYKTARNGVLNYDNILYSTLRGPDFLNRMTLFVARCMLDGVWDAFSINETNDLVYDWKKDKRFEIYAQGLTDNPEYKKLKAAYFDAVRQYNIDHADEPIDPEDGLPTPYSNQLIVNIRNLGDNIYGSYDKSKRPMAEHVSAGIIYGMFSTWLSGIVNNYFMKPQRNGAFGLLEQQEVDDLGRPLFYDQYGNLTTEDTGLIAHKYIPAVVQGIFPTLGVLADIFQNTDGSVSVKTAALKKYLNANPHEKANMRKLLSDLLGWLLFATLFKLALTPAYKEYKKDMSDNPLVVNMITELLYKSSSRSYDQYKGPLNVLQFFGENMNSPIYSLPTQLMTDALKFVFGEKEWKYLVFNNTGLTRSFKDSGFAYIKSMQE